MNLHPAMTVQQIAEWCAAHAACVTIEWHAKDSGEVVPLISARPMLTPAEAGADLLRRFDDAVRSGLPGHRS